MIGRRRRRRKRRRKRITDREGKGGPELAKWQAIAENFFILEAFDSEVEGDELDELYGVPSSRRSAGTKARGEGGHGNGINIAYLDGHVKWSKLTFNGNDTSSKLSWKFPSGSKAGENCDIGLWTAPDNDTVPPATDSGGKACY